jgi:predicted transglutaminase-like cysteine proteinase
MSAKARAQDAARWLLIPLSLGFITAAAAVDADATPDPEILVFGLRGSVADSIQPSNKPFAIALAMPTAHTRATPSATPPQANIAPLMSPLPAPAPAQFFTISEVIARRTAQLPRDSAIQLASADPTASDAIIDAPARNKGDEPFGLFTFVAPDGQLWTKWRNVAEEIHAAEPALARCLADSNQCSPGAARFGAIVNDARAKDGRARIELVNQRVNDAIRYKSDLSQWGVADLWSPPLAANDNGSFDTGFGDCEDFAIAKYVALRAAGVPAKQLRVLLVRDNIARLDHAVLAANEDGHWFILDNRWTAAVEDNDVRRFIPLFALDDEGVKLLAAPYASRVEAPIEPMSEVVKGGSKSSTVQGAAEQSPQPAQGDISALGLRGAVL